MSNFEEREYQQEAVNTCINEHRKGVNRQLIALPCGTGKTIVAVKLIKQLNKKTLILAHRDELIQQANDKTLRYWPEADVGIVKAKRKENNHQIVVGSVQSCINHWTLKELKKQAFEILIIDEAHHAAAPSYKKIIEELGFMESSNKLLLGITATAERNDKLGLGDVFQKIVFSRDIKTMIDDGWLVPVHGRKCLTKVSLKGIPTKMGDFEVSRLAQRINIPERNLYIVQKYLKHAKNRKTIAFCANVKHCQDLADIFNKHGIVAQAVWGAMDTEKRSQALKDFKDGKIQVLVSCNLLTEGYDQASVNCILMARPTKSRILYVQILGRGLRLDDGKKDCLVLDFCDKSHKIGSLMSLRKTIPDAKEVVDDDSINEAKPLNESALVKSMKSFRQKAHLTEVCDKQFDFFSRQSQKAAAKPEIKEFEWIDIGDGESSFADDNDIEIIIRSVDQKGSLFVADIYNRNGNPSGLVVNPIGLKQCQSICQNYIEKNMVTNYSQRNGSWMELAKLQDPTEAQIDQLQKAGVAASPIISRATAAVLIRRIMAVRRKKYRNFSNEVTEKQRFYLEKHGIIADKMTKLEAMKLISRLKTGEQAHV